VTKGQVDSAPACETDSVQYDGTVEMMNTMKRILFVDDEPAILSGLKSLLYKDRKRWDLVFALGGNAALDEIRKCTFDIVVSDMRMPDLDGAALLQVVKAECPATVRIMLSGYADGNDHPSASSAASVHQQAM
jgi:DNA-binding NtrC family response regulator